METYPIWQMQILPNCLYMVAHGSSKTTICIEGMYKSCSTHFLLAWCRSLALHTVFNLNRFLWRDAQILRYEFSLDLRGRTIALTLHMGVLSKTFAIKSCTNPVRHIFPWLPGEAVDLHTGVRTKTFAMSVLYLKTKLNWGNRIKPGEADNFFTTAFWRCSMIACQVSWISDEFWIY